MSQIVTRKGPIGEDKDKRQTDSPVKEMKKKIAANAEKEKQAAEKSSDKSALNDKKVEKTKEPTEKTKDKEPADKPVDKKDKQEKATDKIIEKKDKAEKSDKKESSDKKETNVEKPAEKKEKSSEKKEVQPEKSEKTVDISKEKNGKPETTEDTAKKPEQRARENGGKVNGEQNGDTVSSEEELQESDVEKDEMFPELAYDDSDAECFEPPTPEGLPSRSYTRRSQVKATRTPETPRPASDKNTDKDYVPEDSKLLKLKEDTPISDRRLRSSNSPKPQDKKIEKDSKKADSPKKDGLMVVDESEEKDIAKEKEIRNDAEIGKEKEIEIIEVIEIDNEAEETRVKNDTNYSKSRVKVSPYRRSSRLADQTNTSLMANYTGNNTTMEMDITTETSSFVVEEPESPFLSELRSIRGRRSYKPLKEMTLRNIGVNRSARSAASLNLSENPIRPTGTVVGRKRKPDAEDSLEVERAVEAEETRSKRARLLERLARPFRHTNLPARSEQIVGINTDLPLTAPVAAPELVPEDVKATPCMPTATPAERDSKKCIVM